MEAQEYIKKQLTHFVKLFKKTKVRYEYDTLSRVHTIEVRPNKFYNLDPKYLQWEEEFYENFTKKFPTESICFVSDEDLVGIENVDFMAEGYYYRRQNSDNLNVWAVPN